MVADERLTKYRLCSDWEPTGTALVVNSCTTARRIACFLFSMLVGTLPARVLTTVPRALSGCADPCRVGSDPLSRRRSRSIRLAPTGCARPRSQRPALRPPPYATRASRPPPPPYLRASPPHPPLAARI